MSVHQRVQVRQVPLLTINSESTSKSWQDSFLWISHRFRQSFPRCLRCFTFALSPHYFQVSEFSSHIFSIIFFLSIKSTAWHSNVWILANFFFVGRSNTRKARLFSKLSLPVLSYFLSHFPGPRVAQVKPSRKGKPRKVKYLSLTKCRKLPRKSPIHQEQIHLKPSRIIFIFSSRFGNSVSLLLIFPSGWSFPVCTRP